MTHFVLLVMVDILISRFSWMRKPEKDAAKLLTESLLFSLAPCKSLLRSSFPVYIAQAVSIAKFVSVLKQSYYQLQSVLHQRLERRFMKQVRRAVQIRIGQIHDFTPNIESRPLNVQSKREFFVVQSLFAGSLYGVECFQAELDKARNCESTSNLPNNCRSQPHRSYDPATITLADIIYVYWPLNSNKQSRL